LPTRAAITPVLNRHLCIVDDRVLWASEGQTATLSGLEGSRVKAKVPKLVHLQELHHSILAMFLLALVVEFRKPREKSGVM
jgi:hypothetical protein